MHIDVKKLGRINRPGHRVTGIRAGQRKGAGWERVHVAVDGATRLAYSEVLANEKKETACGFLLRAVAWFSTQGIVVERILTDNGSAYRSHLHRQTCAEMGIRHSRTRPYRPRTNGKACVSVSCHRPLGRRGAPVALSRSLLLQASQPGLTTLSVVCRSGGQAVASSVPRGEKYTPMVAKREQETPKHSANALPPGHLGELQTAVLQELWSAGEATVREVRDRLEAGGVKLAYTTVLTVMTRLHARGLLTRVRQGRRDQYRPAVEAHELQAALLREAVDRLLEAHGDIALAAFAARMRDGDPAALATLRELLDGGRL